jgi:CHAT domain-containing protein
VGTSTAAVTLGEGPVELAWLDVVNGIRTLPQAVQAVTGATVDDDYLAVLDAYAWTREPPQAYALLTLARAATAGRAGGPWASETGWKVELDFVRAASQVLVRELDGRVARAARPAAQDAVDWAREHAPERLVDALTALGSMCSNFITVNSRSQLDHTLWLAQRQFAETHWDELERLPEEVWQLPPAADFLRVAGAAYAESAALTEGSFRGQALKAQATTLAYLAALDEPVDDAEIAALAREAAGLIDPQEALGDLVTCLGMLLEAGEPPGRDAVATLLVPSGDALISTYGRTVALEIATNTAALCRGEAADLAERALARARWMVEAAGSSRQKAVLAQAQLFGTVASVPGGPDGLAGLHARDGVDPVLARAEELGWDPAAVGAALSWLALDSGTTDEETSGLLLVEEVASHAPVYAVEHASMLDYLRAALHVGQGANLANADEPALAIAEYGEAMRAGAALGLTELAMDCLTRIETLTVDVGADGAIEAIVVVGASAMQMENLAGDAATDAIQRICRHAIAGLGHDPLADGRWNPNPEAFLLALQVAKGMRFASLLVSTHRFGWDLHQIGGGMLDEIARLEHEVGPERSDMADRDRPVDDNLLLAAAHIERVRDPDATVDRLRALRRTFDERLHREMLGDAGEWVPLHRQAVETSLDARTALVELYIGRAPSGNAGLYVLGLTQTEGSTFAVDLGVPDSEVQLSDDEHRARGSVLAVVVAALRRSLLVPSEPDDVSAETADDLAALMGQLLAGLGPWLDEWAERGIDILQVVPHGAMHYVPYHLLPHHGQPLAATWSVSLLPNRALLLDSRGGATVTRRQMTLAAFGLTYLDGSHGLRPLTHAVSEATAVAAVFGTTPILDGAATEPAVRTALARSRYVHIAAHGRHDYEAPSFQCVYLAADADTDGLLRAHELVAMDLRGTEMVTLSACETALGMQDGADNPRGLPAALLLAGVRCVVGTAWDVRSDTSEFFFVALYRGIAGGASPREAFTAAQRATRTAFPVYRDWGAFVLSGLGDRD